MATTISESGGWPRLGATEPLLAARQVPQLLQGGPAVGLLGVDQLAELLRRDVREGGVCA